MSTQKLPSKGKFHCPVCVGHQAYRKHVVSDGLKIAGLALWRWGRQDEFVECLGCHFTFIADILLPESQGWSQEPLHLDAAMRVMLLMMMADGEIAQGEIDTIRHTWRAIAGKEVRESAIRTQAEHAKADPRSIQEYLAGVARMLTERGKTEVVRSALAVAVADGAYQTEEQTLMREIVALLGMRPDILESIDVPVPPPVSPASKAPPLPVGIRTVTPSPAPDRNR